MASRAGAILDSLKQRLETINTANGYDIQVKKVFLDEIPMGIQLEPTNLPAILIISAPAQYEHEHQWLKVSWLIELQLIHDDQTTDNEMHNFQRAVSKCIFANSPTIERNEGWRDIGAIGSKKITSIELVDLEPDLHLIEANRLFCMRIMIKYHTSPTDL